MKESCLPITPSFPSIWFTIDIETLRDTNFQIRWKDQPELDYESLLNEWIELCNQYCITATCFILGNFAERYPNLVRMLSEKGHEIACHGLTHDLVYQLPFEQWKQETRKARDKLQELTGQPIKGYRSPSWSLPFEKRYYVALAEIGFEYSSSYFPFKNYLYGNSIDRKKPFKIHTDFGSITEIPVPKCLIPFSGGLYLRVLPSWAIRYLSSHLLKRGFSPIAYIHPYELSGKDLIKEYRHHLHWNLEVALAFYGTRSVIGKLHHLAKASL